ncbi:MAG: MarR family transcriptional regulator [Chitinivibrionales bacterium]|nr:MarR family transcriptional regulator [Chitinivibrionales bacterium]
MSRRNEGAEHHDTQHWGSATGLDALLVYNILLTHNHVSPFLDRSLRDLQLTSSQLNVMLLLIEQPKGLPLSEIGKRLVVSKANVTGLIDRLEQKGYVCRNSCDDRRVTRACLTEEGHRTVTSIMPAHEKTLAKLVGCLNKAEKRELVQLLSKLRRGIREACWDA